MKKQLASTLTALVALGLTGCPADDDGDTTNVTNATTTATTTMTTTDATESSGGQEESSTATTASTTTPAEESSTAPAESSSGGDMCSDTDECQDDTDCAGGGMCLACICVGGEETGGGMSDYGPCDMCAGGETPIQIMGIEGCFCSPSCDGQGSMCPEPNEGTAMAVCALGPDAMAPPANCALICDPAGGDGQCPTGATCVDTGMMGIGICEHPVPG
jgi:hypothetical protein